MNQRTQQQQFEIVDGLVAAWSIVLVLCPLANWVTVGSTRRNSYAMFRSAQRLGIDQITPLRVLWFLLPVFALAIIFLVVFGQRRWAAGGLILQGVVVGLAGVLVVFANVDSGLGAALGVLFGWTGALLGGLVFSAPRIVPRSTNSS